MKRWAIIILLTGLVLSVASPAVAAKGGKVKLISERSAAVVVGDTVWLAFTWRAEGDLENFRIVVKDRNNTEISYPENTASHSGPYQSEHLMDGEIDYTAIRIHVPETAGTTNGKDLKLRLEASWDDGAKRKQSTHNVKIPTAVYEGRDVAQVTEAVEVPAGHGAWVEVAFAGLAPSVDRFTVTVGIDARLPITYPGYGTTTSLHHDASLEDGETDVVRFFVDAAAAEPGEFTLELMASYARGNDAHVMDGAITVSVVP